MKKKIIAAILSGSMLVNTFFSLPVYADASQIYSYREDTSLIAENSSTDHLPSEESQSTSEENGSDFASNSAESDGLSVSDPTQSGKSSASDSMENGTPSDTDSSEGNGTMSGSDSTKNEILSVSDSEDALLGSADNDSESDLQGDGTQNNPYQISDIQSLYAFANKATDTDDNNKKITFQNVYVELTADIVFNDTSDFNNWDSNSVASLNVWSGIPEFDGNFDGKGHTISGLYIQGESSDLGFFCHCNGAYIHDINFSDAAVSVGQNAGIVAGSATSSQIINVSVQGKTFESSDNVSGGNYGGFTGSADGSTSFSNCKFDGTIQRLSDTGNAGGITGRAQGAFLSSCTTAGNINGQNAGGMIGFVEDGGNSSGTRLSRCNNSAFVTANGSDGKGGGLIGYVNEHTYDDSETRIEKCSNTGNLIQAVRAGGLIGESHITNNTCRVSESFNTGVICGSPLAGGIEGYTFSNWANNYITDCFNTGKVKIMAGKSGHSGGIVGAFASNNPGTITVTNCISNVSSSDAPNYGIFGYGVRGGLYPGPISFTNLYYRNDGNLQAMPEIYGDSITARTVDHVTGLNKIDLTDQLNYSGFDFSKTWTMCDSMPLLAWTAGTNKQVEPTEFTFKHPLPVIEDEQRARAFLCFIFNKSPHEMDKISSQNKYLLLITGKLTGTDDDRYLTALSLLQLINANLIRDTTESNSGKENSREALINYLEKRAGIDEETYDAAGSAAHDAVSGYLKDDLSKVVLGLATLADIDSTTDGKIIRYGSSIFREVPLISGNVDWIVESMEKIKDKWGIKDDLKHYVYDLAIAINSVGFILNSEYTGRYEYFQNYLKIRRLFGPEDGQAFDLMKETIKFTAQDNNWFAGFIPVITAGKKSSWSSNTELIDEWAEYTWQLQKAVFDPESTDSDDTPAFQNYTYNQIQCPVDVDIVDENGNVIASIKDNAITKAVPDAYQNQLYICTVGDAKHIFINEGSRFKLNITATESGTMNYSSSLIRDGVETIVNNTASVSLTAGKKFAVDYREESPEMTSYAQLTREDNEVIPISNNSHDQYTIQVNVVGNGFVTGPSQKRNGDNVLLRAVPDENNVLSYWQNEDGSRISTDEVLQFTINKNTNVTAVFTQKKNETPESNDHHGDHSQNSSGQSFSENNSSGNDKTDNENKNPVTPAFNDVREEAFYYPAVCWAVQNNITRGTSSTTFSPESACTRAQMITFLWNLAGRPEPSSATNPFSDIKKENWYYKAVLWAVENHMTTGTTKTTFSPDTNCTRAQAITFLWHMQAQPDSDAFKNPFSDVKEGKWYEKSVTWAADKGITIGTSDNIFSPDTPCTRAQSITFIYKMAKQTQ